MEVRYQLSLDALEQIERRETNIGRSKRLRIVILAMRGFTAPAIALSIAPRAASRLVRRKSIATCR